MKLELLEFLPLILGLPPTPSVQLVLSLPTLAQELDVFPRRRELFLMKSQRTPFGGVMLIFLLTLTLTSSAETLLSSILIRNPDYTSLMVMLDGTQNTDLRLELFAVDLIMLSS